MLIFDQLNKADRHLRALSWLSTSGLAILLAGLWWVQVVRSRHYVEDQRNQSYRTVRVPAPRGKILDRNGMALAENRPVYNVSLYLDDRGWRDLVKKEYAREVEAARANSVAPPRKLSWSEKLAGLLGMRKSGAELRRLTVAEKNVIARRSRYAVVARRAGHARQASTSSSKAAPPRNGSATGRPRRLLSDAINWAAASADNFEVLRLTPAQRMPGLVRRPSCSASAMVSSISGSRNDGRPSTFSRPGSWQTTITSGWLPCSRASVTPA